MATTGEMASQGLATGQTAGGFCIVPIYIHILTSGPSSCSDWKGEQDEAVVLPLCVCVCSSVQCVDLSG